FEVLILAGTLSGHSRMTILRKRVNYRKAFDKFDWHKIAAYDQRKLEALLQDPGIVRNRLKVQAALANAKAFIAVREEFGTFSNYIWSFVGGKPVQNKWKTMKEVPALDEVAVRISKDLKKRGFKFVG